MADSTTALAGLNGLGSNAVQRLRPMAPPAAVIVLCAALGVASGSPNLLQSALAVASVIALCVVCVRAPAWSVIAVVGWLSVMSMIRRVLLDVGAGGGADSMLLVGPATVALLVVVAARRGAFRPSTPLARGVVVLTTLVALSALNPLQGGPAVGLAGLLFVLVPLLWFWIGRAIVDDRTLEVLFRVVAVLSLGAAAYGLFQVFRGFPAWDKHWIATKQFVSLNVGGGSFRQFASFASTSEYVGFIGIGFLVWALRVRAGRVAVVAVATGVLGWAIILSSTRGVLVLMPVSLGIVVAAKHRMGIVRAIVAGLIGLIVLGAIVSILPAGLGGARTGKLVERQIEGLSDPFNSEISTLPIHVEQLFAGLSKAIHNPIGHGVGSITLAARTFGGNTFGTESDPSNVAVALGIPGLLAYCYVVVVGFRLAFREASRERGFLTLVALGVLVLTSLQWLNGGNYAIAPFAWLLLGWLDRRALIPDPAEPPAVPAPA